MNRERSRKFNQSRVGGFGGAFGGGADYDADLKGRGRPKREETDEVDA